MKKYTRRGKEVEVPDAYYNLSPSIFVDCEFWYLFIISSFSFFSFFLFLYYHCFYYYCFIIIDGDRFGRGQFHHTFNFIKGSIEGSSWHWLRYHYYY